MTPPMVRSCSVESYHLFASAGQASAGQKARIGSRGLSIAWLAMLTAASTVPLTAVADGKADEGTAPPKAATFADVTERMGIVPEYIGSLGNLKLNTASANLRNAEAELTRYEKLRVRAESMKLVAEAQMIKAKIAKLMVEVRQQRAVVAQLERDLKLFNRARGTIERDRERLMERAKLVNRLLLGRRFPHSSRAWGALDSFLIDVHDPSILEQIEVTSWARASENFMHSSSSRSASIEEAPAHITNVEQLIAWMRDKRYLPKAGSPAQRLVRSLVGVAAHQRMDSIDELDSRLQNIEEGRFENWKLPFLLQHSIPASVAAAAKRIEEAGV